jgi:hypothetical protein
VSSVDGGGESPGQQRREFVRTFVEHSWTRPGTERPSARPHVVLTVATLAAVVALGAGVALQLIRPVALANASSPSHAASSAAGYAAVAGWDCPGTGTSGFEARGRQASWYTVAEGGWAQDGCHGTFEVMPISANAGTNDQAQSAVWWFVPHGATRCVVMVYVPRQSSATYRPAPSAQFYVMAGRSGQRFAQFVVDQSAKAGSWVEVGTYPSTINGIAFLMVSQGPASSPDTMLAITQVKVACTG